MLSIKLFKVISNLQVLYLIACGIHIFNFITTQTVKQPLAISYNLRLENNRSGKYI